MYLISSFSRTLSHNNTSSCIWIWFPPKATVYCLHIRHQALQWYYLQQTGPSAMQVRLK